MIRVERTFDAGIVTEIMTDPEIWQAVSEDDMNACDFKPDVYGDCWLLVTKPTDIMGVYNLHPWNSTTLEMHIHILPKFRKDYARASVKPFYQWVMEHTAAHYQKLIAKIPSAYPNVRAFAEENGFELEGTITKAYTKQAKLVDIWLLGATMDRLKDILCQK